MNAVPQNIFVLSKRQNSPEWVSLEATVPTGFECMAKSEIIEKFHVDTSDITMAQGRVYFNIKMNQYRDAQDLRSVDNINIVSHILNMDNFIHVKESDLKEIRKIATDYSLLTTVTKWAKLTEYTGNIIPMREEHDDAKIKRNYLIADRAIMLAEEFNPNNPKYVHNILKYRVTCTRSQVHSFTSTEAATVYGGEINDNYNWVVALDDWDLNILLQITGKTVIVSLKLTRESMHRRCIVRFGPTTLRPTIAYSMLRLCNIQEGERVLDPLCGGGSIPIEAAYGYPASVILCGDIHHLAVERVKVNIAAMPDTVMKPDAFLWDARHLPFMTNSIDVVCSDFPFGIRIGNPAVMGQKYIEFMHEIGRIMTVRTGRACILVQNSRLMRTAIEYQKPFSLWQVLNTITVNVGGMGCTVFLLRRRMRMFAEGHQM